MVTEHILYVDTEHILCVKEHILYTVKVWGACVTTFAWNAFYV